MTELDERPPYAIAAEAAYSHGVDSAAAAAAAASDITMSAPCTTSNTRKRDESTPTNDLENLIDAGQAMERGIADNAVAMSSSSSTSGKSTLANVQITLQILGAIAHPSLQMSASGIPSSAMPFIEFYSRIDEANLHYHLEQLFSVVVPALRASPLPGVLMMSRQDDQLVDDPMTVEFKPLEQLLSVLDAKTPFVANVIQTVETLRGVAQFGCSAAAAVLVVPHSHATMFYTLKFSAA